MTLRFPHVLFSACAGLAPLTAMAAPALPPTADPARIEHRLRPQAEPKPCVDIDCTPAAPKMRALQMPEDAESHSFMLKEVKVEGATAYSGEALRVHYGKDLGQSITLKRAFDIAAEITQAYRDDGYILAQAFLPPQKITDGTLLIRVVEGHIGDVAATGDYRASRVSDGMITKLKALRPINIRDLERYILLLSDLAGIKASAVLEPVPKAEEPGSVRLTLNFTKVASQTSLSVDNGASRFTGPYQAGLRHSFYHFPLDYHRTTLSLGSSLSWNRMKYAAVDHAIPLTSEGTGLTLSGILGTSEPGDTLKPSEIEGDTKSLILDLSHPFLRSRATNLSGDVRVEWRNAHTDALSTTLYDDKLRIARAGLSFDHADKLGGANTASLTFSQGLDILGASDGGDINLSRAEGEPDFTKLEGSLSRLQYIAGRVSLFATVKWQYAFSPLLASEEFGYGGQALGRAYDASELVGDHGVSGLLELRYSGTMMDGKVGYQPYLFYDIGKVWNIDTLGGDHPSGSSAGVGIRLDWGGDYSGDFYVAQPLTRAVENPYYGNGKNPHFGFVISRRF